MVIWRFLVLKMYEFSRASDLFCDVQLMYSDHYSTCEAVRHGRKILFVYGAGVVCCVRQ
jgi:hypothetical protein